MTNGNSRMTDGPIPDLVDSESQLDALLARPTDTLVQFFRDLEGDVIILGIAGKMGVSLGQLAVTAIQKASLEKTVYGVARFSNPGARTAGVERCHDDPV